MRNVLVKKEKLGVKNVEKILIFQSLVRAVIRNVRNVEQLKKYLISMVVFVENANSKGLKLITTKKLELMMYLCEIKEEIHYALNVMSLKRI